MRSSGRERHRHVDTSLFPPFFSPASLDRLHDTCTMEESIDGLPPVSPVPTAPNHLPLTPCVVHPASPSYASTTTATAVGRGSSQSQSHDIDTPVASDRAATGDESTPPPPSLSPSPPHSLYMDVAGSSSTLAEIHTSIPRSLAHRPSLFRRRTRTSGDEPLASPDESLVPIPHVKHRQWKDRIDRILHREGGKAARDEPSTPSLFPRRLDRGRPRSHSAPLLLSIPVKVVSPSPSPYTTALSSPAPSTTELPISTKVSCWEALPRELKLDVLGWIVPIFREELDISRARDEEVTKERENDRWAGEAGGWRELVRISIVRISLPYSPSLLLMTEYRCRGRGETYCKTDNSGRPSVPSSSEPRTFARPSSID